MNAIVHSILLIGIFAILTVGCQQPSEEPVIPEEMTIEAKGSTDAQEPPFQKFSIEIGGVEQNLGEGQFLVAMLSATCGHCRDSVPFLNDLALIPELPTLVSLILGSEQELEEFRLVTQPEFPTKIVQPLEFFEFIENAPPRLALVQDGHPVRYWDWEDEPPRLEEVVSDFSEEPPEKH